MKMYEPNEMLTRYIVLRITLDKEIYPSILSDGKPSNVKIIRTPANPNNINEDSLTIDVNINKTSGLQTSTCTVTISGMLIDDINAIMKVNLSRTNQAVTNSTLEVFAGYEVSTDGYPPLVYKGAIYLASPDFNSQDRSRPFTIQSMFGFNGSVIDVNPVIVSDKLPLENLFTTLAKNIDGISAVKISGAENQFAENVNFQGSAIQQLQQACADYGFKVIMDTETASISRLDDAYSNDMVTISSKDILLGYPTPQALGCSIRTRFSPAVKFGQKIMLDTSYTVFNGDWYINGMNIHLTNRGQDFTSTLQLNKYNQFSGA